MDSQLLRRVAATVIAVSAAIGFAPSAQAETSPENGKIAFLHTHRNENTDIYTINPDGTDLRRLTNNEVFGGDSAFDSAPIWSPDGRKILFERIRGTDEAGSGIFTMNADGSALTQLGGITTYAAAWLPDGRVAYQDLDPGAKGLYAVRPDGTSNVLLGPAVDTGLVWSPDGSMFAYELSPGCCRDPFGYDIFTRKPDGSGERKIIVGGAYAVWRPANKIAFLRFTPSCCDIYTINPDGTDEQRLTDDDAVNLELHWSPDATKLLFISDRNRVNGYVFDIFTMNADGNGLTDVTPTATSSEVDAVWSPDGRQILFTSNGVEIGTVNVDGTDRARVTSVDAEEEGIHSGQWQPLLRSSFPNAAAFCRAHREAAGERRFAERWGDGPGRANAFGKCVSSQK